MLNKVCGFLICLICAGFAITGGNHLDVSIFIAAMAIIISRND